mgnify:CR=1 FL=1
MSTVDALLADILANPDAVANMSMEQIADVQKKINLFGVVIPAEIQHANISIVNHRDTYLRRIYVTALIGYLFRCAAEYKQAEHTNVVMPDELYKALGVKRPADAAAHDTAYRNVLTEAINGFLRHNFEYNPDKHVRSAFKDNLDDPERAGKFAGFYVEMKSAGVRVPVTDAAAQLKAALPADKHFLVDAMTADAAANLAKTHTHATAAAEHLATIQRNITLTDQLAIVDEARRGLLAAAHATRADCMADAAGAVEWVPPVDVFHHFDRYLDNHYELFREATQILYAEKPDIEFAVQFYDKSYQTMDEAIAARDKIADRVSTNVITISNEGWYMLGPFKKNRERIDFYNKNTEILKRMAEQAEQDSRLGADLMKNRVRRHKHRNIIEAGPDDPGLEKYKSALGTIEALGAKSVLTNEEKSKMAEAVRSKEMAEVPDDAIQVDVFKPVEGPDGTTTLAREKFYTKSEAPTHMTGQDGVRPATLQSRTGETKSIAALQKLLPPGNQ